MTHLPEIIAQAASRISAFDEVAAKSAEDRQNQLTKPAGSLGELESLSIQLAGITGQAIPKVFKTHVLVFAGDHGVAAAHAVSAFPQEVTAQMVYNFARGGAVINAITASVGAGLTVIDVGVASDLDAAIPVLHKKVGYGTKDWTVQPAMTVDETVSAFDAGYTTAMDVINTAPEHKFVVVLGEMGIGNTTSASALTAALLGVEPEDVVGRGTGVDYAGLQRKVAVIKLGLTRVGRGLDAFSLLQELGGFEIAAMVGAMFALAGSRCPIVLDGVISTAAGLVAAGMDPKIGRYFIAGHQSTEAAHRLQLEGLRLKPVVSLGLRLGEASGGALALPILQAAAAVLRNVATFAEAGVSDKETGEQVE
jgi:nicotinate-nucleotide--dimethylbenzimidazole phosphoribosyltransferase